MLNVKLDALIGNTIIKAWCKKKVYNVAEGVKSFRITSLEPKNEHRSLQELEVRLN